VKRRDLLALAAIALVAAGYTIGIVWERARHSGAIPNYDNYALYYPNLLYALDSLRLGEGVLWNRFQNCGQPFFGIAATAILYPPHAVYLFFAPHTGLFVLTALHFFLAGLFAYALFREMSLDRAAALAGSAAFQLGGITLSLAFWSQTLVGHFLWIPAAMAVCERILRRPSAGAGLLLGIVLSVQFLAGYPPITVFTYQLIALRFLWELATGDRSAFFAKLGALALGLVLPVGLIAVQLFPSLELAGESLRNRALTPQEIRPPALSISFEQFRRGFGGTNGWGSVVVMVPAALAAVGLVTRSTRRLTVFYLVVGLAYAALAFENPVSAFYSHLPLGKSFRMPQRFLWLSGFAVSVLAALGVQAAAQAEPRRWSRAAAIVFASACGIAALAFLSSSPLGVVPWALAAATVVALALAAATGGNVLAIGALPALVLANQLFIAALQFYGYLPDDSPIYAFRQAFAQLSKRVTLQDRIYPYSSPRHFGLQRKSASIFRIPSIGDYESQTSERFVELYVRMINERPMKSINDFYYQVGEIPKNRPLFNLLAARYVVLHTKAFFWPESMRDLELRQRGGGIAVFENPNALPRAYFVPRVEVVADRAELLERLASTTHDPRRTALVETPPPGGDLGSDAATGSATIVEDHGEELRVRVIASAPGFLVVTDQLYPGWEATVDVKPQPITRANYAFRAVRVPQGESVVVFRYRPLSFRLGRGVSALSATMLAAFVLVRLRRKRRSRARG
jgi:hypothetical protein